MYENGEYYVRRNFVNKADQPIILGKNTNSIAMIWACSSIV
jgi:hypothetical protein